MFVYFNGFLEDAFIQSIYALLKRYSLLKTINSLALAKIENNKIGLEI